MYRLNRLIYQMILFEEGGSLQGLLSECSAKTQAANICLPILSIFDTKKQLNKKRQHSKGCLSLTCIPLW